MEATQEVKEDEKSNAILTVQSDDHESQKSNFEDEILDITKPFPDLPGQPEEPAQFTVRALIVGTILGAVVSASNMYLCLKTGWTFGASLFGKPARGDPTVSYLTSSLRCNPRLRDPQTSQQLPPQTPRRRLLRTP